MRIRYFSDTDTAYLEFSDKSPTETRSVGENAFLELGADGNLVAMTIEHAQTLANLSEVSFHQMHAKAA